MRTYINKVLSLTFAVAMSLLPQVMKARPYESVPGDPMQTRIYTLDNGLKVYLSVNKEKPRITAHIAVNTGSRNDPAETTGLAHYLEHIMFKGTKQFGTTDYAKEKPYLDKISNLYEEYRTLTDPEARKAKYHEIDSVSQIAAQYNIPNEYDKMMSAIGSQGTNAYTSYDVTCYVEDIPSNELERWAIVQADRFQNMVMRGFHTELEAVYEEKNISMTKDSRKSIEALLGKLFPSHSYGTQTTIGTQEHLKNPSQVNIQNYFNKYYVPNNVAICMAGDLDPDETIALLEKHFGSWKPTIIDGKAYLDKVPGRSFSEQPHFTAVQDTTVLGQETENVILGWRLKGANNLQCDTLAMVDMLLSNGEVGLIDNDLNNKMKVLGAGSGIWNLKDYSIFILQGTPNEGQTLEEVKDLMLAELDKIKKGDWDESVIASITANDKLAELNSLDNNRSRVSQMVDCYINDEPWEKNVHAIDRRSQLSKADIMKWANEYLGDGYVCVYKKKGEDTTIVKIDKPAITPIPSNRDLHSKFIKDYQAMKVHDIEPQFVDFKTDMQQGITKSGLPILYKQNTSDDRFDLIYRYDFGDEADKSYGYAAAYMDLIGTKTETLEQIKRKFYDIACSYGVHVGGKSLSISISGLQENMPKAVKMVDELLQTLQSDTTTYNKFIEQIAKSRMETRTNQSSCYNALVTYGLYGAKNPETSEPSISDLRAINPTVFTELLKNLSTMKHEVLYWGPATMKQLSAIVSKSHKTGKHLAEDPQNKPYTKKLTTNNEVIIAPYDAPNINMRAFSIEDKPISVERMPLVTMFNEYFGGGMNAVVFQELRETRGLAYNAWARYVTPALKNETEYYQQHIISQNDKMMDCIRTFKEITDTIPMSEEAFKTAKQNLLKSIAAARTTKAGILNSYISARNLGINYDINKVYWEKIPSITLQDIVKFEQENIKGKPLRYVILGKESALDLDSLKAIGPVTKLTLDDIFSSYK